MTLDPNLPPPVFAPAPRPANTIWLLELIPLVIGLLLGREIAYEQSIPGNFLGGIGPYLLVLASSFILAVIGVILLLRRSGYAARMTFAAIAVLVASTFGTYQVAIRLGSAGEAAGLTYHNPVIIKSIGTTQITLAGVATFSGVADNGAACATLGDSAAIGEITTLNAGELGSGTLRGTLTIDKEGRGQISFWIDGADLPEGAPQPTWDGPVVLRGLGSKNVSGDADFTNVAQPGVDPGKGPGPDGTWPASISGSMHWTCRA